MSCNSKTLNGVILDILVIIHGYYAVRVTKRVLKIDKRISIFVFMNQISMQ